MLATVYGDVHDIGKSLVNTILSNNGYTVYDLGKQVPVNTIIDKAVEVGATAIGLSALLVSTSKQMPICVQELDRRGLDVPGADWRRRDQSALRTPRDVRRRRARRTTPGVFYCKDAFEGLDTMESLIDDEKRGPMLARAHRRARARTSFCARSVGKDISHGDSAGARSAVAADNPVPKPPFWGAQVRRDIPLDEVLELLDLDELFRLQWGGRGSGPAWEKAVREEFRADAGASLRERGARTVARAAGGVRLFPRAIEWQRADRL